MNASQQVGFSEKLVRSICKMRLMRQNDFNLASLLCSYRQTMNKSFTTSYCGSKYHGTIDNESDWRVYFFGQSDVSRLSFACKVSSLLKHLYARPFVCYDIGAGRGDFSLALGRLVDTVFAFEQSCNRYCDLLRNIEAATSKSITAFNVSLADKDGSAQTVPPPNELGKSTKRPNDMKSGPSSVAVKRGDTVAKAYDLPLPDLIRVNAGTNFRSALNGLQSSIETSQPVILIQQSNSARQRFADETDLRTVLYESALLFTLSGSRYRERYWLNRFDPEASWIVCYPPRIKDLVQQEIYRLSGLPAGFFDHSSRG